LRQIRSLKALGAGTVICAEPTAQRQKLAKDSGADMIVNPITDDVVAACQKATGGLGVDVALDAWVPICGLKYSSNEYRSAGLANGKTLNTCISATRAGGQITNIGESANLPHLVLSYE